MANEKVHIEAKPEAVAVDQIALLRELIASVALSPEKLTQILKEVKTPYVDEALEARNRRERAKSVDEEAKMRKLREQEQELCPHTYQDNGKTSISLMHNFHDQKPRGFCHQCKVFIEPVRFDFRYEQGEITQVILPAHKLYPHVLQLDAAMS